MTWVHQDPVTKSQRFTNSAGALLSQRIDLDPWGNETARTIDPTSLQQKPVHRFTTYERDANGSDEAMHRRYNSVRARFEQPDPYDGSYDLSNPQSFNRYAYTHNDPVNFIDPTGLDGEDDPVCLDCPIVYITPEDNTTITTNEDDGFDGLISQSFYDFLDYVNGLDTPVGRTSHEPMNKRRPQNPVDISEIGDPPPLGPVHCDERIIEAMNVSATTALRIRKADGRRFEMGFTYDELPSGAIRINMHKIDPSQGSNRMSIDINQFTVALFHYHHGSWEPNGEDLRVAHGGNRKDKRGNKADVQQDINVYAFAQDGLGIYDPSTKKATKLLDGRDWSSAKKCK